MGQQSGADGGPNLSNVGFQVNDDAQVLLPKKLIVCGRYRSIDPSEQKLPGGNKEQPFVALIDTQELERGRQASA